MNNLKYLLSIIIFFIIFFIDQYVKYIFVSGYRLDGSCISLVLAYNKGVAFSTFEFLGGYLKYFQIAILIIFVFYIIKHKLYKKFYLPIALMFAGAISNIVDRFMHIGVVDYIYWHCYFDFAIFNIADVSIDMAVVIVIYKIWNLNKKPRNDNCLNSK